MMYEEPSVVSREALCATLKKNVSPLHPLEDRD